MAVHVRYQCILKMVIETKSLQIAWEDKSTYRIRLPLPSTAFAATQIEASAREMERAGGASHPRNLSHEETLSSPPR